MWQYVTEQNYLEKVQQINFNMDIYYDPLQTVAYLVCLVQTVHEESMQDR